MNFTQMACANNTNFKHSENFYKSINFTFARMVEISIHNFKLSLEIYWICELFLNAGIWLSLSLQIHLNEINIIYHEENSIVGGT